MSSMHSLIGKLNRELDLGKNGEGKAFYNSYDSAISNDSAAEMPTVTSISEKAIVDLDLIVEKWISYMWEKTKTKQSNKYEFEDLDIVVNWAKVDLIQEDVRFETKNSLFKQPNNQILFRTHFTNQTDVEQEYSFKTERVSRQCCTFSFNRGFSREKEAAISFKLPQDIIEIGGGIKSEQTVEAGKDQTKEEEVTWGVDNLIRVAPKSKTIAELVITELQMERNFFLDTYMKGRLLVTLNYRKENNAFVKSFTGDITEIIRMALEKFWLPRNASIFEIVQVNGSEMVKAVLKGKCRFRLGVEQHVILNEEKLKYQ